MSKLNQHVVIHKGVITFQDTTAKKLFELPRYATLLDIKVQVVTAFNDSGTDVIDIGTAIDGDYFVNDYSVVSEGFGVATLLKGGNLEVLGFKGPVVDVFGTYIGQNSNASAGKALVFAEYAVPFVNP